MSKALPAIEDWNKCRTRIEYEDGLLNMRVNIFLVLNGLGAALFGLSKSTNIQITIAIIVILINVLLWLSTIQTSIVIRNLTREYLTNANDPIDMCVRNSIKWIPRYLRPTYILGVWIPLILIISWISYTVFIVFSPAPSIVP
jgi:hypothetical protein